MTMKRDGGAADGRRATEGAKTSAQRECVHFGCEPSIVATTRVRRESSSCGSAAARVATRIVNETWRLFRVVFVLHTNRDDATTSDELSTTSRPDQRLFSKRMSALTATIQRLVA